MIEYDRTNNVNKRCIYKLLILIPNKIYIGSTSNLYDRLKVHKSSSNINRSMPVSRAISEFGWNNVELEILELVDDKSQLKLKEKFYIHKFNSEDINIGYNFDFKKCESSYGKKVLCITTGEIFNSIKSASRVSGVSHSHISHCCNNYILYAGKLNDGTVLTWKHI